MRAIWKGSISFGLVNIPIALYPATRREELNFRLLRKSDLSPINYKRVAEVDGKEVPWEEIVKGYEYEKGKFVVLKEEDFRRADIEATQSVDIIQFVKLEEIDPIFFDKPYYLEPDKKGVKAYGLLREALRRTDQVGVAKVVIKTRQHLAAVKPEKKALVLELMHFADELIEPGSLQIPDNSQFSPQEFKMAIELIERMAGKWDPSKYSDDYRNALLDLIHKKIELGDEATVESGPSKRKASKVIDLVSILKESLEKTRGKSAESKPKRKLKKAA